MKNQALELHSPLPKSFKVYKERTMEKRKTEDSSCSLLSHFWSTFRSPFFTLYIPFQSSGSQESNASNRVRFGAEMRKIWPSEENCSSFSKYGCYVMAWMQSHGNFSHPEAYLLRAIQGEVFNSKFCINPLEPISMAIERESEKESNIQQFRNPLRNIHKLVNCPRGPTLGKLSDSRHPLRFNILHIFVYRLERKPISQRR
ncbi:hypothetical protein AAG906_008147 [Vitis piasezkii]